MELQFQPTKAKLVEIRSLDCQRAELILSSVIEVEFRALAIQTAKLTRELGCRLKLKLHAAKAGGVSGT